jgi:hypothetical protein
MNPIIKLICVGMAFGVAAVCIPAFATLFFSLAFTLIALAVAIHAIKTGL